MGIGWRLRKAFTSLDHCTSELVQLFDEIDLLVNGKVRETGATRLFRSEHFLQRVRLHKGGR